MWFLQRRVMTLVCVIAAILVVILVYMALAAKADKDVVPQVLACADLHQGCSLPGLKVQALQTPSAMRAFTVKVDVANAAKVEARFEMRDMSMGLNQYRFLAEAPESWQASVILPVCINGRSDWLMLLDVTSNTGKLQRYQLAFTAPAEQGAGGHDQHGQHRQH